MITEKVNFTDFAIKSRKDVLCKISSAFSHGKRKGEQRFERFQHNHDKLKIC